MKPLEELQSTVRIDEKAEYINPTVLFTRLAAIAQQEDDVARYFYYELSVFPPSLFRDGLMRKPDKPSLRKSLMSETDAIQKDNLPTLVFYTVDGGALLHRVRWMKGTTYQNVANQYVTYVQRHYSKVVHIVFDGYGKPSTKSNEHSRRTCQKGVKISLLWKLTVYPVRKNSFYQTKKMNHS